MPSLGANYKKKDDRAFVSWIVNDSLATLPALCDDIDELLLFKRNHWNKPSGWLDFLRFLRNLKRQNWDYVIDAQGLFRSGLCAWFAGNGKNVYGFSDAREGATMFYDHKIEIPPGTVHAVDKNLQLVGHALDVNASYAAPSFKADPKGAAEVDGLLNEVDRTAPILTVAVGSRWPSKNWPPDFFAAVLARVIENASVTPVLIGSPGEVAIGQAVVKAFGRDGLVNLIGKTTISAMVEIIRRSKVLMTNDSGPMHIAAAMSIPTVTFFGPTAPEKTGPYGTIHTVFKSSLDCSPCFKRICPLPEQSCLSETVSPNAVAEVIADKLKEAANE